MDIWMIMTGSSNLMFQNYCGLLLPTVTCPTPEREKYLWTYRSMGEIGGGTN